MGDGDPTLERRLRQLVTAWPGRVGATVGFDRALSHRLLAGVDALLIPSTFEPCGLTQMQAMRLGALCIAHGVGGLAETITDLDENPQEGDGFLFTRPSVSSLLGAVDRARALWAQPDRWGRAQERAMRRRWSWESGARDYDHLYRRTLAGPARALPAPLGLAAPGIPRRFELEASGGETIGAEPVAELLVVGSDSLYAYWDLRTISSPDRSAQSRAAQEKSCRHGSGPLGLALRRDERVIQTLEDVPLAGQLWLRAEPGSSYVLEMRRGRVLLARSPVRSTPRWAPRPSAVAFSPGGRVLGSGEL
jgi:hypothetical protein